MTTTGTKKGDGVRIVTPTTRKTRDKDSHEEAGDDNQDCEDNHAEDNDVFEDHRQLATRQKKRHTTLDKSGLEFIMNR
jgi:hypothetical protein